MIDYKYIYDELYKIGYHSKGKNHGAGFLKYFVKNYKFNSILEVGCANGIAVRDFHKYNKIAYGIDVSDIAIRYCTEVTKARNCIEGSVLNIPFKDRFFDAVFSCDVLEHLRQEDIVGATKEIVRVVKSNGYLFLKISSEIEHNREFLDTVKRKKVKGFNEIENLHLTVQPHDWWIEQFTRYKNVFFEKNIADLLIFRVI